jgi:TM2 domain-containing membrane protein YozV
MDCANHNSVSATAYCQNCGKPLCVNCVRTGQGGQIYCEPCWLAWQSAQAPFVPRYGQSQPNPVVAAALGIIPGVGAMYNGQFVKGLIHLFIFAVLVSTASHFGVFGLFIAGWVFYQVFEAYHVAKARRDGNPLPDPLGLNEIGNWLNFGPRGPNPPGQAGQAGAPGMGAAGSNPAAPYGTAGSGAGSTGPGSYGAGPAGAGQGTGWQAPYQGPYQGSSQGASQGQYPGQYPGPGFPPVPPIPPFRWKRKEPIGAVILIGLGFLFLMGRLDLFSGRVFELAWPLLLIGLGVWMVVRHMQDAQGGPK